MTADALFLRLALGRLRAHWWEPALRESAIREIASLAATLGAPDEVLDPADQRLLLIAHHGADVLRGYAVPLVRAPYVMTVVEPDLQGPDIRTDADGLRVTMCAGSALDFATWRARARANDGADSILVVGNSTSWGVGTSCDARRLASRLNADGTPRAFDASVKGSNLAQQRLMAESRLPEGGTLVVVGGVLDLIFALSWPRDRAHGDLPFWDCGDADLTCDGAWAFPPGCYDDDAACTRMRDELHRLGALARERSARVLVVMQPHLDFLARSATAAESALARAFACELGAFRSIHSSGVLRAHAAPFTAWLAAHCREAGVEFADANEASALLAPGDCFLDHIHLSDAGHAQLAATVAQLVASRPAVARRRRAVRVSAGSSAPAGLAATRQRCPDPSPVGTP